MGPNARVPSSSDVASLLSELNEWKQQEPHQDSRPLPRQGPDRVRATYLQAVLLLIRPVLMSDTVDADLVELCVNFAVDACEVFNPLYLYIKTWQLIIHDRAPKHSASIRKPTQTASPPTTSSTLA